MRALLCVLLATACSDLPPPSPSSGGGNPPGPDASIGPSADASVGPPSDAGAGTDGAPPAALPDLAFDHYHSLEEIGAYLRAVAAARPATTTLTILGQSAQGREVAYVVINATGRANPPALLANGCIHGNEKPATEVALSLIDHLLRQPNDPDVASLLGAYAIYVLPVVNPDGHQADTREDAMGNDLNRDFSHPNRADADSFHEVESRLEKSLLDTVMFKASLTYHTGLEMIVWPWGYTYDPAADDARFATMASAGCQAAGYAGCVEASHNYPADGLDMDYSYWRHGTLAVTVEVSEPYEPDPSVLPSYVDRGLAGSMAVFKAVHEMARGTRPIVPAAPPLYSTPRFAQEILE